MIAAVSDVLARFVVESDRTDESVVAVAAKRGSTLVKKGKMITIGIKLASRDRANFG